MPRGALGSQVLNDCMTIVREGGQIGIPGARPTQPTHPRKRDPRKPAQTRRARNMHRAANEPYTGALALARPSARPPARPLARSYAGLYVMEDAAHRSARARAQGCT